MREMKDSGVAWIGEIPKEWEITQLKHISHIQTGSTPTKEKQNEYYSDESGIPWIKAENLDSFEPIVSTKEYLTEEGKAVGKIFPENTIFVCCIASVGKVGFANIPCSCNQQINGITFNDKMNWKYGFYLTISQEELYNVYASGNVMRILNTERQSNLICTVPPLSEQQKIAALLDKKCTQIDTLISNQQQQIEKLKAYKQSLITEVVTKGLNPDVPMKDSGVEWIGEIPESWEISRIKNLFSLRNEKNYESDLSKVNLISLYTDLGVIQHSDIVETTGNRAVTAEGYKIVHEDDIVVNIILCWMGAVGRSAYNGVTSPAYDIYKPKPDTYSKYYHYLFRTNRFNGECYKYGRGIMMMRWRTYSTEFTAINIPVPPIDEQKQIVEHLDKKCSEIDSLIAIKQQKIEKLQQYKKSVIYEYVTGKKGVE